MAASDHLNGLQFMSVSDIGRMPSQYREGYDPVTERHTGRWLTNEEAYHRPAAVFSSDPDAHGNWMARQRGFKDEQDYQANLTEDIRKNGIQAPIAVDRKRGLVDNGHHRWMAARALGHDQVPVEYTR